MSSILGTNSLYKKKIIDLKSLTLPLEGDQLYSGYSVKSKPNVFSEPPSFPLHLQNTSRPNSLPDACRSGRTEGGPGPSAFLGRYAARGLARPSLRRSAPARPGSRDLRALLPPERRTALVCLLLLLPWRHQTVWFLPPWSRVL